HDLVVGGGPGRGAEDVRAVEQATGRDQRLGQGEADRVERMLLAELVAEVLWRIDERRPTAHCVTRGEDAGSIEEDPLPSASAPPCRGRFPTAHRLNIPS